MNQRDFRDLDQPTLRYEQLIESHLHHLERQYRHLHIDEVTPPQFYFLTTTFIPFEARRDDLAPMPPSRSLVLSEKFYVRFISRLMNNFERKRSLQPLTYLYIDYPFSKREKRFAALSPLEQLRSNPFHLSEHPETSPHVHWIMIVPPRLVERFEAIRPSLERLFQSLGPANATLDIHRLQTMADLRRAIFYSSKLLKRPPLRLRDIDLYTVLPKAKSEPIYVKAEWERELEAALNKLPSEPHNHSNLYKYIEGRSDAKTQAR